MHVVKLEGVADQFRATGLALVDSGLPAQRNLGLPPKDPEQVGSLPGKAE